MYPVTFRALDHHDLDRALFLSFLDYTQLFNVNNCWLGALLFSTRLWNVNCSTNNPLKCRCLWSNRFWNQCLICVLTSVRLYASLILSCKLAGLQCSLPLENALKCLLPQSPIFLWGSSSLSFILCNKMTSLKKLGAVLQSVSPSGKFWAQAWS